MRSKSFKNKKPDTIGRVSQKGGEDEHAFGPGTYNLRT
jgi:hypothetical protein